MRCYPIVTADAHRARAAGGTDASNQEFWRVGPTPQGNSDTFLDGRGCGVHESQMLDSLVSVLLSTS